MVVAMLMQVACGSRDVLATFVANQRPVSLGHFRGVCDILWSILDVLEAVRAFLEAFWSFCRLKCF